MRTPTDAEATALIDASEFVWHQSFRLSPEVWAPGVNVVDDLFARSTIPASLDGLTVLDIGTTNGAAAFEAERRGAARVVAVDICDDRHYGFGAIAALLDSNVEFVTSTVYELDSVLDEQFDIVIFWGVLYHLRHPLLGLDAVRRVSRGLMTLETVVNDAIDGNDAPLARFHRLDDLGGDGTNWWSPSTDALCDWIMSAGFDITSRSPAPQAGPTERIVIDGVVTPGDPEYRHVSYELPLEVVSPLVVRPDRPTSVTIDDVAALRARLVGDETGRHADDTRRFVATELDRSDLASAAARWVASDEFVTTWPTNPTFARIRGNDAHRSATDVRPLIHLHTRPGGPTALDVALASVLDPTEVQIGRSVDELLTLPLARLLSLRLIAGAHGSTFASLLRARDPLTFASICDPIEYHLSVFTDGRLDGSITETTFEEWLQRTTLPTDPQIRTLTHDALAGGGPAPEVSVDSVLDSIALLAPTGAEADLLVAVTGSMHLPQVTLASVESVTGPVPQVSAEARSLVAERAPLDAALHAEVSGRWARQ